MKRYISDLHFFDPDVMEKMDKRPFVSVDEMNETLIRRFNECLKKGDEIYILGDLFDWKYAGSDTPAKIRNINKVLHKLNGKLYLVPGNHDRDWLRKKGVDLARFAWIRDYSEIEDQHRKVILCHYPIPFFGKNHERDTDSSLKVFMVHGHLHDTPEAKLLYRFQEMAEKETMERGHGIVEPMTMNLINAFCGYADYYPLTLSEWKKLRDTGYTNRNTIKKMEEMKHGTDADHPGTR